MVRPLQVFRFSALSAFVLLSLVPAGAAQAAVTGCDQLTVGQVTTASGELAMVATLPATLSTVQVPSESFSYEQGGTSLPVQAVRRAAQDLAVVVVLTTAPDATDAIYQESLAGVRDLISGLPEQSSVALVRGSGTAQVVAPLQRDRAAVLERLAATKLLPGDDTDDALQLAARQVPGGARGHIVLVTPGTAAAARQAPAGTLLHQLQRSGGVAGAAGCPSAGAAGGLLGAADAVVARLSGEYDLTIADPVPANGQLVVDHLGTRSAADVTLPGAAAGPAAGSSSPPASPPAGAVQPAPAPTSASAPAAAPPQAAAQPARDLTTLRFTSLGILLLVGLGMVVLLLRARRDPALAAVGAQRPPVLPDPRPQAAPPVPQVVRGARVIDLREQPPAPRVVPPEPAPAQVVPTPVLASAAARRVRRAPRASRPLERPLSVERVTGAEPVVAGEPEVRVVPVAAAKPEVRVAPAAAVEPEVRVEPVAAVEPEVRVEPVPAVEPEVRVAPVARAEPVVVSPSGSAEAVTPAPPPRAARTRRATAEPASAPNRRDDRGLRPAQQRRVSPPAADDVDAAAGPSPLRPAATSRRERRAAGASVLPAGPRRVSEPEQDPMQGRRRSWVAGQDGEGAESSPAAPAVRPARARRTRPSD